MGKKRSDEIPRKIILNNVTLQHMEEPEKKCEIVLSSLSRVTATCLLVRLLGLASDSRGHNWQTLHLISSCGTIFAAML